MLGFVRKIIPFSAVDGPGNRTAVFFQGCNFRCWYCHNPETQALFDPCMKTEGVQAFTPEELATEILLYKDFVQGVTISGGECTLQYNFLYLLCRLLKNAGMEVFIDTNAHLDRAQFIELGHVVDKFVIDVKTIDQGEHLALTAVSNTLVLQNLHTALALGKIYEVRNVVVPKALDNEKNVTEISKLIAKNPDVRLRLIRFRAEGVLSQYSDCPTPDDELMDSLCQLAEDLGVKTCKKN